MRLFLFSILIPFLHSCIANDGLRTSAIADANVLNLSKLSIGMTEGEVLAIMREPQGEEQFVMNGNEFDVWFYITTPTVMGQIRLVAANLTPLTFKDKRLMSWGSSAYRYLMNQCNCEKTAAKAPSKGAPQPQQKPPENPQQPNWGPVTKPQHPQAPQQKQPSQQSQPSPSNTPTEEGQSGQPTSSQPQKQPSSAQPHTPASPPAPQPQSQPPQQPKPKAPPSVQQPPSPQETQGSQQASAPNTALMDEPSSTSQCNEQNGEQQEQNKKPPSSQPSQPTSQPLNEEERKELQESSDQEFNQT